MEVDKTAHKETTLVRDGRGLTEDLSVDHKGDGAILTAIYEVDLTTTTTTKWCLIRISSEGEVDINHDLGIFCVRD